MASVSTIAKLGILIGADTKQFNKSMGRSQKRMGSFGKSTKRLTGSLLGLFGAFSAAVVIGKAFNTIKEFEQANADLAAVLNTTRSEIVALTADAERLGATTAFTATEVAGLQKEYAKFGFTESQILDVTEATLNLAAATGEELGTAAQVVAGTLKGFGLKAKDTEHLTNVMALSFSKSALDMESFSEAMRLAAPIAKAAGVSMEETAAAAAKLADANIKGSLAGTALKKIFSELAKTGKPFNEALADLKIKLNAATTPAERLAIAEDAVGERAKAAILILSEQTEGIGELKTAFEDVGDVAKRMADTQLNTLQGSMTKLSSAWDGFIISLNSGEGSLSNFFKGAVDGATWFINLMQLATKSVEQLKQAAADDTTRAAIRADAEEIEFLTKKFQDNLNLSEKDAGLLALKSLIAQYEQLLLKNPDDSVIQLQLSALETSFNNLELDIKSAAAAADDFNNKVTGHGTTTLDGPQSESAGIGGLEVPEIKGTEHIDGLRTQFADLSKQATETGNALNQAFGSISLSLDSNAKSWDEYGKDVLHSITQIIGGFIAKGVSAMVANALESASLTGPFGFALGPALAIAAGGLAKTAFSNLIPAFADGGLAYGPTLGMFGEYSNASTNPEVIAPLDKLKGLIGGGNGNVHVTGNFKIDGRDLRLVLDREGQRFNQYGGS
ncbi:MAG: phage tail tape measure protein [Gammaproteobacteria bacterium]|nr:MAG: phage tail tape measure protein [Gammaproteobacteria bacterium]